MKSSEITVISISLLILGKKYDYWNSKGGIPGIPANGGESDLPWSCSIWKVLSTWELLTSVIAELWINHMLLQMQTMKETLRAVIAGPGQGTLPRWRKERFHGSLIVKQWQCAQAEFNGSIVMQHQQWDVMCHCLHQACVGLDGPVDTCRRIQHKPVAGDNVARIYMSKTSALFHKSKNIDVSLSLRVYKLKEFVKQKVMELYHVAHSIPLLCPRLFQLTLGSVQTIPVWFVTEMVI